MINRVIVMVLDSVGIGAAPDAAQYNNEGANTLLHVARAMGKLSIPNLESLGMGNIAAVPGVSPQTHPQAAYGRMAERSAGKDTTTGHWEIAGVVMTEPFPTYPDGFPAEIIDRFTERIGRGILGNKAASGTEIIKELGERHMRTGKPIVYTSADSVFQIAAHEAVIPLEQLYEMCGIARGILTGSHAVGRVIARPFTGDPGSFERTKGRHDYSLEPPQRTVLDAVVETGKEVMAVGKIKDIFAGRGITRSLSSGSNREGIGRIMEFMDEQHPGLIFANLVDFDMLYGHRNDGAGYGRCLEETDRLLPEVINKLQQDDVLVITADHGTDPGFPGTDHTRECVPLLLTGAPVKKGVNLGTRHSFSDLGATIAEMLGCAPLEHGKSFAGEVL